MPPAPYTVVDFRNNKSYIIFISKYIFYKYKINGSDFLGDTKGCVIRIIKFTTGCSDPNLYCPLYYILCPPTDDLSLFKRNMANYSIRKKKQKQLLVTCLNSFLSQLLDYSISSKIKWHSQVLFMFGQSVPFSNFEKGLTNKYNKSNIHYLLTF